MKYTLVWGYVSFEKTKKGEEIIEGKKFACDCETLENFMNEMYAMKLSGDEFVYIKNEFDDVIDCRYN